MSEQLPSGPLSVFDFFGRTDSQNVAVMISGGRTSGYLAHRMRADPYWRSKNLRFAYSNTGKEHEATLEFLVKLDSEFDLNLVWVEAEVNPELGEGTRHRIVTPETASRNGEPFEAVVKKYGISNSNFPHCTRELKQNPLKSYFKSIFDLDYVSAIGMRVDEMKRVKRKDGVVYPLVAYGVTVRDVRDFWNAAPFDLQLKDYQGNCDLCWKKSKRKLLTILQESPDVAKWWMEMETRYGTTNFSHRKNAESLHFNRGDESVVSLLELARAGNFIPSTDPFWKNDESDAMDTESPCACMIQEELAVV